MAARPSRDESPDTEEQILRAALQAFSEQGFDGASTREIAARAGVNHGLIPYYFGSKLNLWRSAVDRAFAELEAGLDQVVSDPALGEGREQIAALIGNFARFVARNPEFVRMMHEEGKRRGPRMRWLVDRHARRLFEAVSGVIERARERGELPADVDPLHFYYILAGSMIIFHQAPECRELTGVDPLDDEVAERHAEAVVRLLLGPDVQSNSTPVPDEES